MRVGFDFAAESGDAAVDTARSDHDGIAPDSVHDALPREGAAGSMQEVFKQSEFLAGERDFPAVAVQTVRRCIQPAITKAETRSRTHMVPTEKGLHAGHEFPDAERLRDIVVRPDL